MLASGDGALFHAVVYFDWVQHAPGKTRRAIPARRQFGLEAAYHHGVQFLAIDPDASGETLVVQQFQQRGEALCVAIMGGRREEQFVLKVRSEAA